MEKTNGNAPVDAEVVNPAPVETKQTAKAIIENDANNIEHKKADKLYAPKIVAFMGQLLSADTVERAGTSNSVALTFGLPDGGIKVMWTSEKYWNMFMGRGFTLESYVRVNIEQTVANKTSYPSADEPDTYFYHNNDGERFRDMAKITASMFNRDVPVNTGDIDLITNAGNAAMPVATYLAAFRSSLITSK